MGRYEEMLKRQRRGFEQARRLEAEAAVAATERNRVSSESRRQAQAQNEQRIRDITAASNHIAVSLRNRGVVRDFRAMKVWYGRPPLNRRIETTLVHGWLLAERPEGSSFEGPRSVRGSVEIQRFAGVILADNGAFAHISTSSSPGSGLPRAVELQGNRFDDNYLFGDRFDIADTPDELRSRGMHFGTGTVEQALVRLAFDRGVSLAGF